MELDENKYTNFDFGVLSMGNPHAVSLVDDVDSVFLDTIGPIVQQNPSFPYGVNVGVM